jgi:dihydrofolate synthase/folylpolyglutamate synthase
MNYSEALDKLFTLVNTEGAVLSAPRTAQPRFDLSRMNTMLARLGNPQNHQKTIHVTGTKGKGSTSAMVTSALSASGLSVGFFSSPHLHTFRERIRNGLSPISEEEFASILKKIWPVIDEMSQEGIHGRITLFEVLTAMAFSWFSENNFDYQVMEVGLGGTLDATNVVQGTKVCVITSISLDHTNILGNTVDEIARDKAGIIKPDAVVVSAPQYPKVIEILEEACIQKGARLIKIGEDYRWKPGKANLRGQQVTITGPYGSSNLWIPLLGNHQLENASCALATLESIDVVSSVEKKCWISRGFKQVSWPGRMEVLQDNPLIIADGAHNPYSVQTIVNELKYQFQGIRCTLVVGFSRGHDFNGMAKELACLRPDLVIATQSRNSRSVGTTEIVRLMQFNGLTAVGTDNVRQGVEQAISNSGPNDLIFITGSLFVVAEARGFLFRITPELYPGFDRRI